MSMLHAETYSSVTDSVLIEFGREIRFLKVLLQRLETRWLECCPHMQELPPLAETQMRPEVSSASASAAGRPQQRQPPPSSDRGNTAKPYKPGPLPARQNRSAGLSPAEMEVATESQGIGMADANIS